MPFSMLSVHFVNSHLRASLILILRAIPILMTASNSANLNRLLRSIDSVKGMKHFAEFEDFLGKSTMNISMVSYCVRESRYMKAHHDLLFKNHSIIQWISTSAEPNNHGIEEVSLCGSHGAGQFDLSHHASFSDTVRDKY